MSKIAMKGYKAPRWFRSIKAGSHGSTPAQKKLWRVVSETYRQQDWKKDPRCRTCSTSLASWQDGQCGHYKAFTLCNGWFKYERKNLALQCSTCNANFHKDNAIGGYLSDYLKKTYGKNILKWIDTENQKHRGEKIKEWEIVDYVARMRPDLIK